ncbi:hypothetical protein [Kocuria rosea]|uniref:hypothetical protein n=1 Tax=Kocuria rosea TaxID=1275 RepID=UPI00232D7B09|nr:hypothetical protein [Kocuria rosea]
MMPFGIDLLGDLAAKAAEGGVEAILTWLAGVVLTALFDTVQWLGTWWLSIEAPGMGEGSAAMRAVEATRVLLPLFGVIGMAFGCVRIAREQSRGSVEGLIASMLRSVAAVAVALVATSMGLDFGTQISPWLVEQIGGQDVNEQMAETLGLQAMISGVQSSAALAVIVLVLAFIALLGSLVNAFLVLFSYGMASVLAGLLAFFAAVSTTDKGKKSFDKVLSWLIAVVLFKPVAAIIWGVGLALAKGYVGEGSQEPMDQMVGLFVGLVMVVGASLALPALARVAAPMVAEGPRGMGAGSLVAAGGALATGALIGAATAGAGTLAGGAGARAAGAGGFGGGMTGSGMVGGGQGGALAGGGGTGPSSRASGGSGAAGGTGGGEGPGAPAQANGAQGGSGTSTSGEGSTDAGGAATGSSAAEGRGGNGPVGAQPETGAGGSSPDGAPGAPASGPGRSGGHGTGPSGASAQSAEAVGAGSGPAGGTSSTAGGPTGAAGASPGRNNGGAEEPLREVSGPEGSAAQTGGAMGARASFVQNAVRAAGYEARRAADDAEKSMESGE